MPYIGSAKIAIRMLGFIYFFISLFIYQQKAQREQGAQLISHNLFAACWVLENGTSWAGEKPLKKNNPKATLAIKHVTP